MGHFVPRHPAGPVTIEYTDKRNNARKSKAFTEAYKARQFFVTKSREGCEPKVIS
jgi:hypothetical protein